MSFEYLMIFSISLIILIAFTLPLAETSIKNTMDVSDSLDVKYDLSKLANAVKTVYGQGQGSKQQVILHETKNIKVNIASNPISCSIKLKDKQKKVIKESYKSNLKKTSITLTKGENIITIEWPVDSKNMVIYRT